MATSIQLFREKRLFRPSRTEDTAKVRKYLTGSDYLCSRSRRLEGYFSRIDEGFETFPDLPARTTPATTPEPSTLPGVDDAALPAALPTAFRIRERHRTRRICRKHLAQLPYRPCLTLRTGSGFAGCATLHRGHASFIASGCAARAPAFRRRARYSAR